MREHDDEVGAPKAAADAAAGSVTPDDGPGQTRMTGGDVRPAGAPQPRRLDRAPGDRYRQPTDSSAPTDAVNRRRARRFGWAVAAALGTAIVTFALTAYDVGPGLLVVGLAGGWLTGLALAGARAGVGPDAGGTRAATAAAIAAAGPAAGLFADALRAYTIGGVLLPWEYALALYGWVAPAAIVLAAVAGAIRGR